MAGNNKNANGSNGFSVNLLPRFYQTNANRKFLQSTIDQLYQPGSLTKISGYAGRKNAKASTGKDVYIQAADQIRQNYQLEPGLTITDTLGNVTYFKDYIDYINQLDVLGGNVSHHARLNIQEFYSWDPHIDWDKFVNFQNYYWLPYGPQTINVHGQIQPIASTYSVAIQQEGANNQYVFTPDGSTPDPVLKLYQGQTYTFNINSPGNPFSIKTARSTGVLDRYSNIDSVSAYGVEVGTITFTVPTDAPSILYYQSENDINLGGMIQIYSILSDTTINVEAEILGKATYTLIDGTALSNGMKLNFVGQVTPAIYAQDEYYVEGVGTAIKLIPSRSLEIISSFTINSPINFDSDKFDTEPFDIASGYQGKLDYITINRSSRDRNPWSRYNRWFHQDVINASAKFNNQTPVLDQSVRAKRPIIEFNADIKLYNLGTVAIQDIDLVDDFTIDAFLTIEGTVGYNIDNVALSPGMFVLFTADIDPLVQNKIFRVEYVDVKHLSTGSNQLHLVEVASPELNQIVIVRQGSVNQGSMYWYDGSKWQKGQTKSSINQPPMFDVVDNDGISFGDKTTYVGTTFTGTPIFSYPGSLPNSSVSGSNDIYLGFPLSYQNVNNIGDIVFNFNLVTDSFQYKQNTILQNKEIDVGFLSSLDYAGNTVYVNGWQTCKTKTVQAAVRIYDNSGITNNFNIDIFDDINNLSDLVVKIYINGFRLDPSLWTIQDTIYYKQVILTSPIQSTDILTIRAFASQPINSNGYYEIPINLQNNTLNGTMVDFTLGEVADHVSSIIDNITNFSGNFPGDSNLRDLGNVTQYGTKFVQHSGPISLSAYHITSESNNIIRSLQQAKDDYNNFKRLFLNTASSLGIDGDAVKLVDIIMQQINASKPKVAPYYLSDMVPYGAATVTVLDVVDYRIKNYPLSKVFSLDSLSNQAVGVYHNGVQLIYGQDYSFNSQGFIEIDPSVPLVTGDTITTYEYDSTDGSFVPATPTKLGMWPAFAPKIYLDTTLINPVKVIQGHDGSIVAAYNDYRDDLILELEKRIFNNIKVKYNADIFDIYSIIPSYTRFTDYSFTEFNNVLSSNFYSWVSLVGKDLTTPLNYDRKNSFTFNYSLNTAPDGTSLPGYWRGVYRWLLGTDRPNICPWEMLGFSLQPSWWTALYGPAPYTSDNIPMWTDIANGITREPNQPASVNANYVRTFLMNHLPVDEQGNLISPQASGLASGTVQPSINNNFVFGDGSPVENAWTRSSYYPFSIIATAILLKPAEVFGKLLDRSRIIRNKAGQLIYSDTGLRVRPADILLPSVYSSSLRVQTAGLVNYIVDLIFNYIFSNDVAAYNSYKSDLNTMIVQLSYRVGAFTNKEQFKLILESKTPSSTGNVFIPAENYKVFLNKSSPVKKLSYSGVIITKVSTGFEIKGYSITQPYFRYYPYTSSGNTINVGGISESYATWASGQQYISGNVILYEGVYYRSNANFVSGPSFDTTNLTKLPSLPMQGGVTAILRNGWDKKEIYTAPYGTLFATIQEVVDFLLGYGEYLQDQGFRFDDYNNNYNVVSNWETTAREFLFWTTQNWSTGQEKWSDWQAQQPYSYGKVVRYDGDYYSALYNLPPAESFDETKWSLLPGLSNIGASVISLSPGANALNFTTTLSVVDSITNSFNPYEIFKVNGTPFEVSNLDSYRQGNSVRYNPRNDEGIYGASFYLIQNEHVIIVDNTTIFNDIIYSPTSGYKRDRLKISGYVTTDWYGGLDIPGFIFDSATINEWQPWQDYNTGDVVTYQSYYYSADEFIPGAPVFVNSKWIKLSSKPTPQILPNWTNIATQFVDFYSTDVDSFNTAQQTMAQHLIGYQKRQYLDNIIQDDVSEFKFYQGMIRDKGTQTVLNNLFNALNLDKAESLTFYEEWAIRVSQYGASNAFQAIEFVLDQGKYISNPQGTLLTNTINSSINPFIIQQTLSDIYVSPTGYNSQPFPVLSAPNQFLRDAGYVNPADVFVSIGRLSDLTAQSVNSIIPGVSYKIINTGTTDFIAIGSSSNTAGTIFTATGAGSGTGTVQLDVTQINEGAYIWCAFDGPTSWNVYRFTDVHIRVTNVTYSNNVMTITAQNSIKLNVGSYVGLSQVTAIDGFYKITSVILNEFTVDAPGVKVPSPFTQQQNLIVYALVSQRTSSIDNIDKILPANLQTGNFVWTDDDGTGSWANWIYAPVFVQQKLNAPQPANLTKFGNFVAINKLGTNAAISVGANLFALYNKVAAGVAWTQQQLLQPPFNSKSVPSSNTPVSVIAFSPDGTWMATGSPTAGMTSSYLKGNYNPLSSYLFQDIVKYNGLYFQALFPVPVGQTPSQSSPFWNQQFYVPVDTGPYTTGISNNGIVTIYQRDANNIYQLYDSFLSPSISSENFGSNLVFDASNLYVSAVSNNNNTGKVYKLSYITVPQITAIYDPVNSSGTILRLTSSDGITAGMTIQGVDSLGISAFTSGQTVTAVLTRLLFVPVPGQLNYLYNTSTTAINISKIQSGMSVSLYQTLGGYNYNVSQVTVYTAGLTSVNVLVTTKTLTSGGAKGTNYFFVSSNTNVLVGQLIVGTGVPTGTFVGSITLVNSSYEIVMVDFVGAIQNFIIQGSGSYEFFNAVTYGFVDIQAPKGYSPASTNLPIGVAQFNNDPTLIFNVYQTQSTNSIILSGAPNLNPAGSIVFSTTDWTYAGTVGSGGAINNFYGSQLALSLDGSTLLVSASGGLVGKVYAYRSGTLIQTLVGIDNSFGQGITVSDDGSYIAISDDLQTYANINQQGTVGVYQYNPTSNLYASYQSITDHRPEINGEFGSKISFMNDSQTLIIYSQNGSSVIKTTFDGYTTELASSQAAYGTPYVNDPTSDTSTATTFDKQSTTFITTQVATGRIDIHDRYNNNWVYGESLPNVYNSVSGYGQGFAVGSNNIFIGVPYFTSTYTNVGQVSLYIKPANTLSWNKYRTQAQVVDVSKIKKVFLYNKSTERLLTYLDVIDPIQGKIAGPAEEEITYETFYDPATYSYSDGSVQVNENSNGYWTTNQIGQLWWNLSTAKFVNPYFSDVAYRNNSWNTLAPGASIDIYEWVASPLLPEQWDLQSQTTAGVASGITGKTLYGNSAYSVTKTYNSVTKTFKNTYYYWVANKNTVPEIIGRNISAQAVASLIANPRGQAYTYASLIGSDSFSLTNVNQYLTDTNTVLAVEYWTVNKIDRNIHSQWKLISTDTIVELPKVIQQKWIDSLCGVDSVGRPVPDYTLPVKLQYGIENRPRQSMFINRVEALKEYIEGVNSVLASIQITGNYNFSVLDSYDTPPPYTGSTATNDLYVPSGQFDQILNTDVEIQYTNINLFVRPELTPEIVNGRIVGATIVSTGRGYLQAPYITVVGSGTGAVLKSTIDALGRINSVVVVASGYGYDDNTTINVRDYSVLVLSDSQAEGAWSIYSFNPDYYDVNLKTVTGLWSRIYTKSYDVRNYWSYIDWYASGYNQFIAPDFSVETFVDLNFINVDIGGIVKILKVNTGGWMLLEKFANSSSVDWTQSYKVIGLQNGTIQFSSNLYTTSSSAVGYDAGTFDGSGFDIKAAKELRIILETLQNNILIDDLYSNYLDLFFRSMKYILSEQQYVDWIFKTSFVRATHNVGQLSQPVYYPVDNLSNFQDYIVEVKPYRTKVREYISRFAGVPQTDGVDHAELPITDFDLPATIINNSLTIFNTQVENGKIVADLPQITTTPWVYWLDNVGFSVLELKIISGGSGYVSQPRVVFGSDSGSGATAEVFYTNGIINQVILTNKGSGYLSAPTVSVEGGLSLDGVAARLVAVIGNSVVRSNLIEMKFDRVGQTTYITDLSWTDTFPGTGSKLIFDLTWAPDIRPGKISVTVYDSIYNTTTTILREEYTVSVTSTKSSGYTQYFGQLVFLFSAPSKYQTVTVKYIKDISVLNAIDRIEYYYDPVSGMPGKDPKQLMTGIDYGGAVVGGLGFNIKGGWGSLPFATDYWGELDSTYTDYTITFPFSGGSDQYHAVMPYVAPAGTLINVYYQELINLPVSADGITSVFFYNYNVLAKDIHLSATSTTTSINSVQTTSQPNSATYPIAITVINVIQATGGSSGQASIVFTGTLDTDTKNLANVVVGQFISGTGIPYGAYVTSVSGLTVSLSANLTANASGFYNFFVLGTTLTVASTVGVTVGLGIVGNGFTTQSVSKIVNLTTLILSSPPNTIPLVGENLTFVGNVAGSNTLTVTGVEIVFFGFITGSTLTVTTTPNVPLVVGTVINQVAGSSTELGLMVTAQISGNSGGAGVYTLSNDSVSTSLTPQELQGTTVLIKVGDIVTCQASGLTSAFGYNTSITNIQIVPNAIGQYVLVNITLSSIIYANLPDSTILTFSRQQYSPADVQISATYVVFSTTPAAGMTVNINGYINPVRIDADDIDPNTGISPSNPYAIMPPIVANGSNGNVYVNHIPGYFSPNAGDIFIFRVASSDGSISNLGQDTNISGGDTSTLNGVYATANGLTADDIIIDGDGLVTSTSSPAPEEVVPGQVVDTLAIKVFDRNPNGSARIKVDNHVTNGSTTVYKLSQPSTSSRGIIVKLGGSILVFGSDYNINFENQSITLTSSPAPNQILSIFIIGYAGTNILDLDYFIGDGVTREFVTQAPWLTNITAGVYVDGIPSSVVLFETSSEYVLVNSVGIRFTTAPSKGVLINYIIVSGNQQTFAITSTETVPTNGSRTYTLQNLIGNSLPNESYMIVRVDNTILSAPVNAYFTITAGTQSYTIDSDKIAPYSIPAGNISVLVDNNLLLGGRDYTVDLSGITVTITITVLNNYLGKSLIVSALLTNGYTYNASTRQITFSQSYDATHVVEITSSYQHDSIDLERTNVSVTSSSSLTPNSVMYYKTSAVQGGILILERAVIDENYVWLTKSNILLIPGVDYKLNDNRLTIQLAVIPSVSDQIEVLTYGTKVVGNSIAYMQFKDILNNTSYTRLSLNKRTTLAEPLNWYDSTITLTDASNFQSPNIELNIPGVLEIAGERIQYFVKTGNILSQLRRSISGTGIKQSSPAGTYVQDISSGETIPYKDNINTINAVAQSDNLLVNLYNYDSFYGYITGNVLTITSGTFFFALVTVNSTITSYTISLPSGTKILSQVSGVPEKVGSYTINYSTNIGSSTSPILFYIIPGSVPERGSSNDLTGIVKWFTSNGYVYGSAYDNTAAYTVDTVVLSNGLYYYSLVNIPPLSGRKSGIDYSTNNSAYWAVYPTTIPAGYGQTDGIEVFVGGYSEAGDWSPNTTYTVDTIVNVGSYTYRCIQNHTSSANFTTDLAVYWKFFIGNIRLNKQPYKVHNVNVAPYSPAGDVLFDADFSVDGVLPVVRLTNQLKAGVQVTVIQRTGIAWDSTTNILYDNSEIANFIKAETGIWYSEYNQISNTTLGLLPPTQQSTFDASGSTLDSTSLTFDQG